MLRIAHSLGGDELMEAAADYIGHDEEEADLRPLSLHRRIVKVEDHTVAMLNWKASIEESTEVNKEMVEVGKAMLKALAWVAKGSKWIVAVGGAIGITYAAVKHVIGH